MWYLCSYLHRESLSLRINFQFKLLQRYSLPCLLYRGFENNTKCSTTYNFLNFHATKGSNVCGEPFGNKRTMLKNREWKSAQLQAKHAQRHCSYEKDETCRHRTISLFWHLWYRFQSCHSLFSDSLWQFSQIFSWKSRHKRCLKTNSDSPHTEFPSNWPDAEVLNKQWVRDRCAIYPNGLTLVALVTTTNEDMKIADSSW